MADGSGTSGGGTGQDLTEDVPETHDEAVEVVIEGNGDMTAFGDSLTDQEIADVVAYTYDLVGR